MQGTHQTTFGVSFEKHLETCFHGTQLMCLRVSYHYLFIPQKHDIVM